MALLKSAKVPRLKVKTFLFFIFWKTLLFAQEKLEGKGSC